jgi:hypothetical protein
MLKEHEIVVLTQNLPKERLTAGDVGTVVHIHQGGAGYEVEFMTLAGRTIAEPRPVLLPERRPRFGCDRGRVKIGKDFDAPLPEMKGYTG